MTEFKDKNDNIDDLLKKFYTPDETRHTKNDFASADAFFEKFPAPEPSQQTLTDIKQKIAQQLENRMRTSWTAVFIKTAAVAAIVAVVSALLLVNYTGENPIKIAKNKQQQLWQSDETGSDTDISAYDDEIKQLRSELLAINLGEENGTNEILSEQIEQLELEIVVNENTFWKG